MIGISTPAEFDIDQGVSRLKSEGFDALVLHQRPPDTSRVLQEADRLIWLDGRGPSPQIIASGRASEGDETIIVALNEESAPISHGLKASPELLWVEVGRALKQLHELPTDQCPFDCSTAHLIGLVGERILAGEHTSAVDGPYAGRHPAELLEMLQGLLASLPAEDQVFVHGTITADRMWSGSAADVVFTGWDRAGVGDRHLDLASAAVAVSTSFGPAAVTPLLDGYGIDSIDLRRLDAFQILHHLLR